MIKLMLGFLFLAQCVFAKNVLPLVKIPYINDQQYILYSIESNSKCSFEGEELKINVTVEENGKTIDSDLSFIEDMYFKVEKQNVSKNEISFDLQGVSSLSFKFVMNNCKIDKYIVLNQRQVEFDRLGIDYQTTFLPAVLETMTIIKGNQETKIYPKYMSGYVPAYELLLGSAIKFKSNIKYRNQKKYYKGRNTLKPFPAFIFRYGPFFINRDGMGSLLFSKSGLSILGLVNYDGEPFQHPEIEERKKDLFAGLLLEHKYFRLTYKRNFFGFHEKFKGTEFKAVLKYEFRPSLHWKIEPRIYLQYWSTAYTNYYFGVSRDESSKSDFSYSKLSSGINYSFKMRIEYYQRNWVIFVDTGMKQYSTSVEKSDLVEDDFEVSIVPGIAYKFL